MMSGDATGIGIKSVYKVTRYKKTAPRTRRNGHKVWVTRI